MPSVAPNSRSVDSADSVDFHHVAAVPDIWAIAARRPETESVIALHDPHAKQEVQLTYGEMLRQFQQFAAGLQGWDVRVGDRIALFADNSARWLIADQGMMMAGVVNVVRSSQADPQELIYMLENSGSTGMVVQDLDTLAKLRPRFGELPIQFVVLLSDEEPPVDEALKMINFPQLMKLGYDRTLAAVSLKRDDLATLLYTSGTTGRPKGVMLSHGNLLHQINELWVIVQPQPGDRVLSILPTWHSYERSCEYFLLSRGCTQIYTNLRSVKQDLRKYKPNFMVGVPRLWESIYDGIQKQLREQPANKQKLVALLLDNSHRYIEAKRIVQQLSLENLEPSSTERAIASLAMAYRWLGHQLAKKIVYGKIREATGGEIKQVISGGGSLAKHLDTFFEVIGLEVLVGYGLTETAPVLTARRPDRNLRGSAGMPVPETEIRIVNPDTRETLPGGQKGLVLARGPQIMQGYYRNPEATQKAIDAEGWFDTGDLGWLTPHNDLVLTGRAKDTIVLTNGENIEPQPIEDACLRSPFIDQIMLVGQDQRSLGALIVPNVDALHAWAKEKNLVITPPDQDTIDLENKAILDLFRKELNREVKDRPGYCPDDRIGPFRLLAEPFTMDNGMLTQTLKIRRPVVTERYRGMIDEMFA
jgi:long-chain acyl-CoA synthetase